MTDVGMFPFSEGPNIMQLIDGHGVIVEFGTDHPRTRMLVSMFNKEYAAGVTDTDAETIAYKNASAKLWHHMIGNVTKGNKPEHSVDRRTPAIVLVAKPEHSVDRLTPATASAAKPDRKIGKNDKRRRTTKESDDSGDDSGDDSDNKDTTYYPPSSSDDDDDNNCLTKPKKTAARASTLIRGKAHGRPHVAGKGGNRRRTKKSDKSGDDTNKDITCHPPPPMASSDDNHDNDLPKRSYKKLKKTVVQSLSITQLPQMIDGKFATVHDQPWFGGAPSLGQVVTSLRAMGIMMDPDKVADVISGIAAEPLVQQLFLDTLKKIAPQLNDTIRIFMNHGQWMAMPMRAAIGEVMMRLLLSCVIFVRAGKTDMVCQDQRGMLIATLQPLPWCARTKLATLQARGLVSLYAEAVQSSPIIAPYTFWFNKVEFTSACMVMPVIMAGDEAAEVLSYVELVHQALILTKTIRPLPVLTQHPNNLLTSGPQGNEATMLQFTVLGSVMYQIGLSFFDFFSILMGRDALSGGYIANVVDEFIVLDLPNAAASIKKAALVTAVAINAFQI